MTDAVLLERFLHLLGVSRQEPSIEALTELVTAFMIHVPFENVSKLYYKARYDRRSLPELEQYVDGIEGYHFGGTCYANNYYLHLLLRHLGYDVMLCGADMINPDVHLVNIVSLAGREFLVDGGYAAPFLEPLPRDLTEDYVITLGRDRYVLKPKDRSGNSHLELYRESTLRHGYIAKPIPRRIEHFAHAIEASFREGATFINALLLVRWFPQRSIMINNLTLIESEGTDYRVHQLGDRQELPAIVEKHFSIPREIVSEAIAGLGELGDAWD